MNNKILFALRRSYHCVQTRKVLQQNALSYPVYEIGEEEEFFSFLDRAVQQGTEILITGDVYAGKLLNRLDLSVVTIRRSKIPFAEVIQNTLRFSDRTAIVWRETDGPTIQRLCRGCLLFSISTAGGAGGSSAEGRRRRVPHNHRCGRCQSICRKIWDPCGKCPL